MLKIATKKFSNLIKLNYSELTKKSSSDFFKIINEAYGKDGLGLLVVQNVPGFEEKRSKLFQRIHKLAHLSENSLKKLELSNNYSVGWSKGAESYEDNADISKGSFYALLPNKNGETRYPNVWPDEIKDMEECYLSLTKDILNTGLLLTKHIDNYIKSVYPSYEPNKAFNHINNSSFNVGRNLYYYPSSRTKAGTEEFWCGFHNDHGSLTGLCKAIYYEDATGKVVDESFKKTGLYIQTRKGEMVKANIPNSNDIAFQIGETLQVISGGLLHATPHAVKKFDDIPDKIGRVTLALFMQPNKDVILNIPTECKFDDIKTSDIYKVPKIQNRIENNMTFEQFDKRTIESYYKKY